MDDEEETPAVVIDNGSGQSHWDMSSYNYTFRFLNDLGRGTNAETTKIGFFK